MQPEIMIADKSYHNAQAPNPRSLTLENIAIALGNTCRWGGHLGTYSKIEDRGARRMQTRPEPVVELNPVFYSVAEHSVLGARFYMHSGQKELAKLFLMHDALEPFVGGDIPTPLKDFLPRVSEWEELGQKVLLDAYNLQGDFSMIKDVDRRICRNEVIELYDDTPEWSKNIMPLFYEEQWDRTLIRLEKWTNVQAANEWYKLAIKLGLENKYAA